jgi:hypothetical protein
MGFRPISKYSPPSFVQQGQLQKEKAYSKNNQCEFVGE